ncbi:MAG: hypothetical protein C4526_03340, partial [Nitrospiraceae bacterium]
MKPPERARLKPALFISCNVLFTVCFLMSLVILPGDASAQMRSYFQKKHLLYGSIEFDYEQVWGERVSEFREFSQNYNLGLKSFILDPRLINYDTSVTFIRQKDNRDNASSLTGLNFNINFLETPPRKWSGYRRYIPGPVTLRYSDYSNDYDYRNYGIGVIYAISEEQQKRIKGKKDKKDEKPAIPIPTIYFDYDNTYYSSGAYENISDLYSLRATLGRDYYNYEFTYEDFSQGGTTESRRKTVTFSPDYTLYDKATRRRIDINNFIKKEELDGSEQFFLSSNINLRKPVNKDTLYLAAGAEYTSSSVLGQTTERYSTLASGSYTKVYSPGL